MKRLNLWLAGIAALLFTGLAAFWFLMPAALHYRLFGDEASFNAVMFKQVRPGDSMNSVVRRLGGGLPIAATDRSRLQRIVANMQRQNPNSAPAGVAPDDEFLGYKVAGMTMYFQFRGDKLINFEPQQFEKPMQFSGLSP